MPKVNTGLTSSEIPKPLNTSNSHRCAVLIGTSFVLFEVLFLILYANDFWFSFNISSWGIIALCLSAAAAHFLLLFIESSTGCWLVKPIKRGLPLIFYRRWLTIESECLHAGLRKILWTSISKLRLTIWGNLQIWSNRVCGEGQHDLILTIPFNCARLTDKQCLVDTAQQRNTAAIINSRLKRQLEKRAVPGLLIAQTVTSLIMIVFLLDLGRCSFAFLETLKDYFLAQTQQIQGHDLQAKSYFAAGDAVLYSQTFPSWIGSKFFNDGPIAATVHNARSQALWQLVRKQEALSEAKLALKMNPRSFRLNLHLATILDSLGYKDQAQEQLELAIKNRNDLLLPRLYLLAWLHTNKRSPATHSYYQVTLSDLKDKVFGEEPYWPPGGNHFLPETIYQDDLRFILDRLL